MGVKKGFAKAVTERIMFMEFTAVREMKYRRIARGRSAVKVSTRARTERNCLSLGAARA